MSVYAERARGMYDDEEWESIGAQINREDRVDRELEFQREAIELRGKFCGEFDDDEC